MEVKRLFDVFYYQKENFPQTDALAGKFDGKWKKFSTDKVIDMSDRLAWGLLELGLGKGDMIAIMSVNRVQWVIADQGIMKMGGIVVPLYPTSSEEDLTYVMNHSKTKALFVQNAELLEKINRIKGNIPSLEYIYVLEPSPGGTLYEELFTDVPADGAARLKEIQDSIKTDDLASIIYTSGTTGNPKGVMLSHANIVSNVIASLERLPVGKEHIALSFLPLSHIYERMIMYMYGFNGISIYFADAIETIGENLKEVRPHVFTAVPRLLEKVFDKVQAGGQANTGIKLKMFNWASKLALQWEPGRKNGGWYHFKLGIADKLVFSKIRNKAGLDRVIAVSSGSAALQARLARFYNGIGVPLVEGYGLTETSPVISVNEFDENSMRIGTVGKVISKGEVRIAEDGEILYKGPNLMMGYYENQEKTDEVIDSEGWFHTGDIGFIDSDGFLKITDRKKEMFKTSGGKYIAPQVLENRFKESPYIEQIVVVGEYRKFPGALIVPNYELLKEWCKSNNVSGGDNAAILSQETVQKLFQKEVDNRNEGLARYEKIKRFELLNEELTIDGGELTPSLKIKRKVVDQKYKDEIEKIYDV